MVLDQPKSPLARVSCFLTKNALTARGTGEAARTCIQTSKIDETCVWRLTLQLGNRQYPYDHLYFGRNNLEDKSKKWKQKPLGLGVG